MCATELSDKPETSEILALAPMAGGGIGKIIADDLLKRGIAKKIADAFERALESKTKRWVQTGKGEGYMEELEDTRSQLQAALGLLAHMEGEPVKRIIHQHLTGPGGPDLAGALRDSPELQAALESELQKAKWRTSGNQAHKRPKKVKAVEPATPEAEV